MSKKKKNKFFHKINFFNFFFKILHKKKKKFLDPEKFEIELNINESEMILERLFELIQKDNNEEVKWRSLNVLVKLSIYEVIG